MVAADSLSLLVFDLDGTLIDSRTDLTNAINAMLAHFNKPLLPEALIASYLGDGASMLVRRALGDPEGDIHDEEFVTEALTFFLDYYRVHKVDYTTVYPGVFASLDRIRTAFPNLPMAILTNKPVRPSQEICDHFGLSRYFFQNYGGNSFHTKKPDPHGLLTLRSEASALLGRAIAPETVVMVGDSDVDVLTARRCGALSLGCSYGFAPHALAVAQPDLMSHSAQEWPALLGIL
ncbi:MAG: HAD hydrolase-like protein [Acidobacteriota bacterium]|nr:HAD hydrolase-like protein [Acidobacteriota bacterium]